MVGLIAAAAMVASFFLPWVAFFGTELAPVYFFDENAPPMGDYPWRVYAVMASFVVAALAVLCVVLRRRAGLVMLIAGGIPVGLIAEPILRGVDQIQDLPVEVPRGLPGGGRCAGPAGHAVAIYRDWPANVSDRGGRFGLGGAGSRGARDLTGYSGAPQLPTNCSYCVVIQPKAASGSRSSTDPVRLENTAMAREFSIISMFWDSSTVW